MSTVGLSVLSVFVFSIACTTSAPFTTRPNTVCFPSSQGVATVVMKNCEPFVFGPAFAMETVYGRSCRKSREISSANSPPQIDVPPVPSPSGSPVCSMNPLMTRWKIRLS